MDDNASAAGAVMRRRHANIWPKVKALAWEECRTGGVIAATCLALGLIVEIVSVWQFGWLAKDLDLMLVATLLFPGILPLLLLFRKDSSGEINSGFPPHLLRLPVPAYMAFAVILGLRTFFVLACSGGIFYCAHLLYGVPLPLRIAALFATLYLTVQTFDWLREPVSGLVTALLLLCSVLLAMLPILFEPLRGTAFLTSNVPYALFAVAVAIAFTLGPWAVRANQTGRRYGIPEIWEWHRALPALSIRRDKPFASPMRAQVWFELRRAWWAMPLVTGLTWVLSSIVVLLTESLHSDRTNPFEFPRTGLAYVAFIGLICGGISYAGASSYHRSQRPGERPFMLMRTLTTAQLATASLMAAALVFIPMFLLVCLYFVFMIADTYTARVMIEAHQLGISSYRDVLWTLGGVGVLTFFITWYFVSARTWLIVIYLLLIVSPGDAAAKLAEGWETYGDIIDYSIAVLCIAFVAAAYVYALRKRLIPPRAAVFWAAAWLLTAWLLVYPLSEIQGHPFTSWQHLLTLTINAFAWSSCVPLPYVALVIDLDRTRRRSWRAPVSEQDHPSLLPRKTRVAAVFAAVIVVPLLVWFGGPAQSGFGAYWQGKGYPLTPEEIRATYPPVPDENNRALDYLKVAEHQEVLAAQVNERIVKALDLTIHEAPAPAMHERIKSAIPAGVLPTPVHKEAGVFWIDTYVQDHLLVMGKAELPVTGAIPREDWDITNAYWTEVTSHVAPELKALAAKSQGPSRYPVDVFAIVTRKTDVPHLEQLRALLKELRLDALHWAIAGDLDADTAAILAMQPLVSSQAEEPDLIAQLTRLSNISHTTKSMEMLLNRGVLDAGNLAALAALVEHERETQDYQDRMNEAMVIQCVAALYDPFWKWEKEPEDGSLDFVSPMIFLVATGPPKTGPEATALFAEDIQTESRKSWPEYRQWVQSLDDLWDKTPLTVKLVMFPLTGMERVYEAVFVAKTHLQLARATVAVERYRLAYGVLPENLEVLVPEFLPGVPVDYFTADESPLHYIPGEDSSFKVYSVGLNIKDDGGVENEKSRRTGDITFTVPPLGFRERPQIAAE